eukprot:152331_1
MTALHKVLSALSTTAIIILVIGIHCFLYKRLHCNAMACCHRVPRRGRTMLKVLFLCIGQPLNVLFQILTCKHVGDRVSVHYFFGSHYCYGVEWWLSLIILLTIVCAFSTLFAFIWYAIRNQNIKSHATSTINSYHLPLEQKKKKK